MGLVLSVHGIELDVSVADWEPVRLGLVTRSFSGQARSSVRLTKRDHHFVGDVHGVPLETAELLRKLLEGEGHSWNFNDASDLLTSSRGLRPVSTGAVSDVEGVFGGGALFTDGEADTQWQTDYEGSQCTLMYWAKESGVFVHYLVRYSPTGIDGVWRNLTRTNADPEWFLLSTLGPNPMLYAAPSSVGTFEADDLVLLPYRVPDEWAERLIEFRADSEWAPLPYVRATGAAFPGALVDVLGQVGTAHRVPLWQDGAFTIGEVLDFTLQER